jgi:hypothetical protein
LAPFFHGQLFALFFLYRNPFSLRRSTPKKAKVFYIEHRQRAGCARKGAPYNHLEYLTCRGPQVLGMVECAFQATIKKMPLTPQEFSTSGVFS